MILYKIYFLKDTKNVILCIYFCVLVLLIRSYLKNLRIAFIVLTIIKKKSCCKKLK